MRGKDEVRQTDIDWTFFHRPVTLRDRKGVERGTREVSETTSGEANFSSRFSRIILEKKRTRSKVFRRLVRVFRRASREAALKGETVALPDSGIKGYLDSRSFFEFVRTALKCAVCFVTNGAQSASRYSVKYNCLAYDPREFNSRQIRKFKIVKVSRMNCRVAILSSIACLSLTFLR